MKRILVTVLALAAAPAFAEQQPADPAFLQRALDSVATQRNNALNSAAVQEARASLLEEQVKRLEARIKQFEANPANPPKPEGSPQ